MNRLENVIIIGSGPAGYTAALYAARGDLHPLLVEGYSWGGLLQQTTDIENYPGFSEGIMGPQLMQEFRAQAARFGAQLITEEVDKVELSKTGGVHRVWVGNEQYETKTVILSMGAQHKKLGVPGEAEFSGKGVSYCATCDAAFFREHQTVIVGGGDSAMEEALFLAKFADKVTVVHRRNEFRASKIMLNRVKQHPNIELLTPYVVRELEGESGLLSHAILENTETQETKIIEATGVFVAIGHEPQSQLVKDQVNVDENGYVITEGKSTLTNLPGVFAAGDLVDHTYRQAITAAGSGSQAALDAERYLRDLD